MTTKNEIRRHMQIHTAPDSLRKIKTFFGTGIVIEL